MVYIRFSRSDVKIYNWYSIGIDDLSDRDYSISVVIILRFLCLDDRFLVVGL